MLDFIHKFAEKKIGKAMKNGDFDNLEGSGKPIVYEDDSMIPEDLRMAYKILKNSGYLPPEVQERKDIGRAIDLLERTTDEGQRYTQIQKLNVMISKANQRRNRPVELEFCQEYYTRVVEKVSLASSEKIDKKRI